ncbi:phenylalanyl-tRNA synthetase [Xylona heveae TC161]|uniref:Phenylalanine--tRNA ligase, mitochondrial n=1 Tax=Xylona heveae (strain CBS 132557 / TC161) TaxID=1328760 RepID=A0A165A6Q0_XYLHT|nr:phenylalanyl-tRNA synthetase [Xylona heveae TC161]KZF20029.1 phenylalanyl-tRNA synthetase [Xylona heveae TC161]
MRLLATGRAFRGFSHALTQSLQPSRTLITSTASSRRPLLRCSYTPTTTSSSSTSFPPIRKLGIIAIGDRKYPTDEWTNVPKHITEAVTRKLHLQPDHPICLTRKLIESAFPLPLWKYHNKLFPVVTTKQNFDSLNFPVDHPGRSRTDTYYINRNTVLRTHTSAHQADIFHANLTDGFLISADVYRRDAIDRSHYPVFHQMEGARMWDRKRARPGEDLSEMIWKDFEALPDPGIIVEDPNPTFDPVRNPLQAKHHSPAECEAIAAHLKRSIEIVVATIFRAAKEAAANNASSSSSSSSSDPSDDNPSITDEPLKVRWIEAYFPFTSPSWELEVFWQGDWLELLGCGVVNQNIPSNAGVPSQIGWAFGIGLERIAMLLYSIPDIRLFWSQDPRFLSQFSAKKPIAPFIPFSKYPACYKDVSFWLPPATEVAEGAEAGAGAGEGDDAAATKDVDAAGSSAGGMPNPHTSSTQAPTAFHENDVMEIVRDVAQDLIEDVKLMDEFTHPKTNRKSMMYRLNYRSLERTLTNQEANELHSKVQDKLVEILGVELR